MLRVRQSLDGVRGVPARDLVAHFAGVASLQAARIRTLGEALGGRGSFTLGGLGSALGHAAGGPWAEPAHPSSASSASSASSSASSPSGELKLSSGAWARHWATLEAHVLGKQLADARADAARAHSAHRTEAAALRDERDRALEEVTPTHS